MESNYEWQAVIGIIIFAGSWIGLSLLRSYFENIKIKKVRKKILKAYQKLGDGDHK